jgi:gliding motility-associated-like protein
MQSFKSINYLFLVFLLFSFSKNLNAQTSLEGGDLAVVGVNANNFACSGQNGEDIISIVCFKDITAGTTIDLTDNGWERSNTNQFGDSEGTIRASYSGGTIPAGQVITFVASNSGSYSVVTHAGWTFISLNDPPGLFTSLNLNANGDQLFFMQGGIWDWGNPASGTHDATYNGKILFGFNTKPNWNVFANDSNDSGLHPNVIPCFHMEPSSGQSDYQKYTGSMTAVTQVEWIKLISDASNWTSYPTCAAYNSAAPDYTGLVNFPIDISEMSIDCTVCTGTCSTINETLVFNLPTVNGPFTVVYTDGINQFTLANITDGHTEIVSVSSNTTFSLVSVTAADGCPTYSNFAGEAIISFSGAGGVNASLSGGGVLCTDNCSVVTITITGGTAPPYTLDGVLDLPPLVSNFPVTVQVTSISFDLNVCSQGLILGYDINTATLSVPNFVTGSLTFTLIGITENTGCAGTVDPTPFVMSIEETPTANAAGPLSACDQGGNAATFDLTSLNSTVSSSNTITWYEDMALATTINNPTNYSTTSTIVYATSSTANCESDPVAVQLTVDPSPTGNPSSVIECTPTGIATIDLTLENATVNGGTGAPVSWFTNSIGTNPILNPTSYTSGSGIVYATVTSNGCTSVPVAITLTVNQAPTGVSTTMTVCESMTIPTFGDFDLTLENSTVNGGTGLPVAWFTNASATTPIPNSLITAQNNTIVYALVGTAPCTSVATSVTLLVTPFPPAVSTILEECATFGNQAVFDLTAVDNIVNAGSGATVSWFENVNGTNQIMLPGSYLSSSTFVYAQTSNGSCTSPFQSVELIVTPGITANITSATACDSGNGTATFDLNVIGLDVNNDPGNTVNWYFDSNATIPITSPYTTSSTNVYAQVTNGVCESQIVTIGLAIDITPTANITAATACDSGNGVADFDLNVLALDVNNNPGVTVNWFLDANGDFPIISPYNTGSTTIYAAATNGNCTSPIIPILLNVTAAPVANNAVAAVCDLGNGTGDFDLTLIENDVNSDPGNTISWFLDAGATLPISSPYNTASTIIYAIVSNGNCTSNIAEIILTLGTTPVGNATSINDCDLGDGTANFDLNALAMVVNTNPAYTVNWFLYANATNPILISPFNTSTTFIYAVVSDGAGCESVPTQVDLNVIATPTANTASAAACETANGTAAFDLTALENTVNGGSSNTVSWYSDLAVTNSISSPYNSGSTIIYAVVNGALCSSQPVAVDLTVNSTPTGNPTDAAACINDGSGMADFDLTNLESIVNGGSGDPVLWYSDIGTTNQIFSPYNTGTITVYAIVTVGNCPSAAVPVDLMVGDQPTANIASAEFCDSGNGTATFDLTALENTISGGTSDPVSFFSDAAGTMVVASPFNTATTTVYATVTVGFCPSEPVAINLTVGNSPTANTTFTSLCDDGNGTATFDLSTLGNTINGGSGNTVLWYSDANATMTIASPFLTAATTIYAIVDNGSCLSNIVAVDLNVTTVPSISTASSTFCDEGSGMANFDLTILENTVNGGNGNTVSWYSDANATTTITSPFNSVTTIIYAIVSAGSCTSPIEAIDLTVAILPEANAATIVNCDSGNGTADFDLNVIANTVNGGNGNSVTWYSDVNLTTSISSPFNSIATTIYAVVNNVICTAAPVEVTLEITNDIFANSTSLAACDNGMGIAIFDLTDLNFQNNITGGNGNSISWFVDAAATILLSPPFDAFETAPTSIYAIVVNGNCSSSPVEISLVLSPEVPAANNFSLANCDDGNGTASFDLDSQVDVVNTGNGNQVLWFVDQNLTNQITSPYISAATTIYAIATDGVCFSEIVEVELIISNFSNAFPTTDSQCDDGSGTATFDLTTLENTVNGGNGNTVTWYSDAGATIPSPTTITSGNTSVYAIVTDGICASQIVEITLTVENNLTAFSTTDSQCDDGSGTATFDLTTLENMVNGGNGNTVTWYSDAGATMPSLTTITSSNTSVYAIVTDGTCASQIVEITLIVDNDLTAFSTTDSQCADGSGTATFDLTTLENTVNGGNGNTVTWYSDAGATTPSPTTITGGNTSVYAIVTDGTCASQIVEITLIVDNDLTAFSTTDSQCADGSGTATFDLTTLENTVNGGNGNTVTWYSDAGATTPSPTTITGGNTSVYAIVTDGICFSQTVEIELLVTLISSNNIIQTLCDGESLLVNNVLYDQSNDSGTEIIPGGNMNGCDSIITVDLTFEPEITGTISASANSICPGNDVILTFILTGGMTYNVEFSAGGNPPTILNGISDGHTITVTPIATTTYSLEAVTPLNTNCIAVIPTTQITIQVGEIDAIAQPTSQFGNFNISCFNENDGAAIAVPTSGSAPFQFLWSNGNTAPTIENVFAGDYEVTITDATGCSTITSTTLTQPDEIQLEITPVAPPCSAAFDGQIILNNITGGSGNYTYSLDGSGFTAVQNSPTVFDFISPGEHTLTISDDNGCLVSDQVTVSEPLEVEVSLGPNETIELGDSIEIQSMPNFIPTEVVWSANSNCDSCLTQFVTPVDQSTYIVIMSDENGCVASDTITIFVEKSRHVFIPNAFSPDENGLNDVFYINAGQDVAEVNNFRVFNRWGEVIFENENFQPNDPTEGWDGFFNGEMLNPNVFIFFAEIEFKDGLVKIYKGDVTLTR